ncbi:hypothetical protein PROFUN_16241 [Planoprotostelium fungivorum]|uniref:Uncharacterized protein n=1 Tax=Planoprotostelium fungivorum TaxID=1890364 RepID=A0A2P6MRA3_9EUKA|nr:hypothetical protein PROFUN_16241 [Planoprotostelium fungivorum]
MNDTHDIIDLTHDTYDTDTHTQRHDGLITTSTLTNGAVHIVWENCLLFQITDHSSQFHEAFTAHHDYCLQCGLYSYGLPLLFTIFMGIVDIHPGFSAGWLAVTFMYIKGYPTLDQGTIYGMSSRQLLRVVRTTVNLLHGMAR